MSPTATVARLTAIALFAFVAWLGLTIAMIVVWHMPAQVAVIAAAVMPGWGAITSLASDQRRD